MMVNDMSCTTCPFGHSIHSQYAVDSGCLPTTGEILDLKVRFNVNWGCHTDCSQMCAGFATHITHKTDMSLDGPTLDFRIWDSISQSAAIHMAVNNITFPHNVPITLVNYYDH